MFSLWSAKVEKKGASKNLPHLTADGDGWQRVGLLLHCQYSRGLEDCRRW